MNLGQGHVTAVPGDRLVGAMQVDDPWPGRRGGSLRIRTFIIDEDALVRAGLRAFLTSAPDIDVIGEAPTGEDALAAVQAVDPDVIVIDVRAQGIEGVARRAASSDDAPRPHVIVLTSTAFDEYLADSLGVVTPVLSKRS